MASGSVSTHGAPVIRDGFTHYWQNGGNKGGRIEAMDPEYYRARAAEATRKARADLFNSHIYREIAGCYERLAADSEQRNSYWAHSPARSAGAG